MLSSKDVNFVGYTYKNFEIVQDANVPGVGEFLVFFAFRLISFLCNRLQIVTISIFHLTSYEAVCLSVVLNLFNYCLNSGAQEEGKT